jgi:hypothetical protein
MKHSCNECTACNMLHPSNYRRRWYVWHAPRSCQQTTDNATTAPTDGGQLRTWRALASGHFALRFACSADVLYASRAPMIACCAVHLLRGIGGMLCAPCCTFQGVLNRLRLLGACASALHDALTQTCACLLICALTVCCSPSAEWEDGERKPRGAHSGAVANSTSASRGSWALSVRRDTEISCNRWTPVSRADVSWEVPGAATSAIDSVQDGILPLHSIEGGDSAPNPA